METDPIFGTTLVGCTPVTITMEVDATTDAPQVYGTPAFDEITLEPSLVSSLPYYEGQWNLIVISSYNSMYPIFILFYLFRPVIFFKIEVSRFGFYNKFILRFLCMHFIFSGGSLIPFFKSKASEILGLEINIKHILLWCVCSRII